MFPTEIKKITNNEFSPENNKHKTEHLHVDSEGQRCRK